MNARESVYFSKEVQDLLIADLALTIAFTFMLSRGASAPLTLNTLLFFYLPISFVAVSFSFVLHELMHKYTAQHFGAIAAFRRSDNGIILTLASSFFGILVGIPGATVIYAPHFTKREEAYVSLAGPLTNFTVFAFFFAISILLPSGGNFIDSLVSTTMLVSLIIAFFNMLPIYPLDGSKVLRWSKPVYFVVIAVIFALLALIYSPISIITSLIFMLVIAFVMSTLYRGILF